MKRTFLSVNRFLQLPGECAVAAAATVANFYNTAIDYEYTRSLCNPDGEGMYTPDIALLMNQLGFQKVTVVSSDLNLLDYDWRKLKKTDLIQQMKKVARYHYDIDQKESAGMYVKFLKDETKDNRLIIDHHFGRYIRESLSRDCPVMISFNWQMFFEFTKWNDNGKNDPIHGNTEEHEVVVCGCDDEGVDICDSHYEMYYGKLAKFKSGRYRMDWETLHTVMGVGDLIIPTGYKSNELV